MTLEKPVIVSFKLVTGTPKRTPQRKFFYILCCFKADDANRTANACYKEAADLLADLGQYIQAIARYEHVADHSLTSALTKYSVKEYWLRAGLCALALNVRDFVLTW